MTGARGRGNFFEDFRLGQEFRHATPRTLTEGDAALYTALYGSRFALPCARPFAEAIGLAGAPLDDLLVFNVVFGRTVADVSLNAVANLGYAEGTFGVLVHPGDTVEAASTVIGLKENADGETGIVWVRTVARNQRRETVLAYVRWAMVRKTRREVPAPAAVVPDLAPAVAAERLFLPPGLDLSRYDFGAAGSERRWEDFGLGERIDHVDGTTVEEAEHALATRLFQNPARVHFDRWAEHDGRFGRRIVYGGHVIGIARALSYNGLANAFRVAAVNGGRHVAPVFAGDTLYAWTEVLARAEIPGRADVGALRLCTTAAKDHACGDFPGRDADERHHPAVVLDLDYWALVPRR